MFNFTFITNKTKENRNEISNSQTKLEVLFKHRKQIRKDSDQAHLDKTNGPLY